MNVWDFALNFLSANICLWPEKRERAVRDSTDIIAKSIIRLSY